MLKVVCYSSFCDSHTHLVFSEPRQNEFVLRIKGHSYEEIAKKGGGILNSAESLAKISEDELYEISLERLKNVWNLVLEQLRLKVDMA